VKPRDRTATPEKAEARSRFLAMLTEGETVRDAVVECGYDRATFYRWRDADSEFAAAWERAYTDGTDALEAEAQRRGMAGVEKPITVAGQRELVREYSDTLLIFLLKARRPDKYARFERPVGTPDNPLTVKVSRDADDLAGVAEVLAKAGVLTAGNGVHTADN
jgi:hypothetical protein